jgi:hypothetical protein
MKEASLLRSLETTLILFVVVTGIAVPVIVSRLRKAHAEVWGALASSGEPGLAGRPSAWRLIRFATSFRHLRLDDLTLSLACVAFTLAVLALISGIIGWLLLITAGS